MDKFVLKSYVVDKGEETLIEVVYLNEYGMTHTTSWTEAELKREMKHNTSYYYTHAKTLLSKLLI